MRTNLRWILLILIGIYGLSISAGNVKSITESEFASEVSYGYVLVDFWAPWCGPCQKLGPILDNLSTEYKNVKFVKINVDNNKSIAQRFNIRSIPYVALFKDGKKVDEFTGLLPEASIRKFLTSNTGKEPSGTMNFKKAYDFTLQDLEGNTVKLSEIKGVVVLDFWATWCPPCKKEIPFLIGLKKKYKNVTIIGVSNESKSVLQEFSNTMKKNGTEINYPILIDSDSSVTQMFRIQSIPTTYIIGSDGNLIKKEVGFSDEMAPEIDKTIQNALK